MMLECYQVLLRHLSALGDVPPTPSIGESAALSMSDDHILCRHFLSNNSWTCSYVAVASAFLLSLLEIRDRKYYR